jgi:hypothetical protein
MEMPRAERLYVVVDVAEEPSVFGEDDEYNVSVYADRDGARHEARLAGKEAMRRVRRTTRFWKRSSQAWEVELRRGENDAFGLRLAIDKQHRGLSERARVDGEACR